MTKNNMANNNQKWLLYGFIILAILNIVLLGYIVMGIGGVSLGKGNVGLSPNSGDDCSGVFSNGICLNGDPTDINLLSLGNSQIIGTTDTNTPLKILSGPKGIRLAGKSGNNEIATNVEINGSLSLVGDSLFPGITNNIRILRNSLTSDDPSSMVTLSVGGNNQEILYRNKEPNYYSLTSGGNGLTLSHGNTTITSFDPTRTFGYGVYGQLKLNSTALQILQIYPSPSGPSDLSSGGTMYTRNYILMNGWKCAPTSATNATWKCIK
ncbi:hypothetical protein J4466_01160 [Candidatus Pacearchaeota archaeon]|nr:hypothetical protein [Candidatus Pacearchaeota archaeon]